MAADERDPPGERNPDKLRKKARGPAISGEDRDLWRKVTRDATPLAESRRKQRAHLPEQAAPEVVPEKATASQTHPRKPAKSKPTVPSVPRAIPSSAPKPMPDLQAGQAAGLDRRNLERLRRGQLAIEARLDLHGDTLAIAHDRLQAFLASAQAAGRRCVLVITGKGSPGPERRTGVIRSNLPRWLNEIPNRDRVLAFAQAQPADGGAGAFYVLLKRKRAPQTPTKPSR